MQPPVSRRVDTSTLYELHLRLSSLTSIADRQKIVDAMLLHDGFEMIMKSAMGVVLKDLADHDDIFDDLWQETTLRLERMLLNGDFKFADKGPKSFNLWFSKVVRSVARRGWRCIQPLWMKKCILVSFSQLDVMAAAERDNGDLGNLLIAIDQIEDTVVKSIMRGRLLGKTFAELAMLHAISVSTASLRWRRGVDELKRRCSGD
jgi:hypothetical protein